MSTLNYQPTGILLLLACHREHGLILAPAHTHSHAYSHSHSQSYSYILARALIASHIHSHTQSHSHLITFTLTLSHIHTQCNSHSVTFTLLTQKQTEKNNKIKTRGTKQESYNFNFRAWASNC